MKMKRGHNDKSNYCDIAVATLQDLEAEHNAGRHCDKSKVGDSIMNIPSRLSIKSTFNIINNDGDAVDITVNNSQ